MPSSWRTPIQQGRPLLRSPFEKKHRRATVDLTQKRNDFVTAIADVVFVAYVTPASSTESFCRHLLGWSKPVFTFDSSENAPVIRMGAKPLGLELVLPELRKLGMQLHN